MSVLTLGRKWQKYGVAFLTANKRSKGQPVGLDLFSIGNTDIL